MSGRWWDLPDNEPYLWPRLTHHLQQAGRGEELDALVCDLRWVHAVLKRFSPAEVEVDLSRAGSPLAGRMSERIRREAHTLGHLEPGNALMATLMSRLSAEPELAPLIQPRLAELSRPYLTPAWPLPDAPHPAARRVLAGHLDAVRGVAVSADGTWLATASWDRTVRIWSADGGELAVLTGHDGPVNAVTIAADGTWLASASEDGTVRLWHRDGTPRGVLAADAAATSVAISPDGTWLATSHKWGTLLLWNVDGTPRGQVDGLELWGPAVAISPDGAWFAAASEVNTVRIWHDDGRQRVVLTGHTGRITAIAISPDGTWLATASEDEDVRILSVDGTQRRVLAGHSDAVTAVVISPDGGWLATAGADWTVRLWNANGGEREVIAGHSNRVNAVAISPDGGWLATAGDDWNVRLWHSTARATRSELHEPIRAVAVSPDGRWVATTTERVAVPKVRLENIEGTDAVFDNEFGAIALWDYDSEDGIPSDSDLAPVGTAQRTVLLWNANGTAHTILGAAFDSGVSVASGADGTLAIGTGDGNVLLWHRDGHRSVHIGRSGHVVAVARGQPATLLAIQTLDDALLLWSTAGGARQILRGAINAAALSPDGNWLATAGSGLVRVWATGGAGQVDLGGHIGPVLSVAISPDSTWLAGAGADGTVRIWGHDHAERAVLTDHAGPVNTVAISPDGTWLATVGDDRTLRVWDTATYQCATALRVGAVLRGAAWFPDAKRIAIGGAAGLYVLEFET